MSNCPLVSVLVPLYNHASYIEQCLDSVLNDPWPSKEIIIIDDGSNDESARVVEEWYKKHSPLRTCKFHFESRENRGLTNTLNQLVSKAKGEFIAILASDDYLLPGGITSRVMYLQQNREKDAVFGDCEVVDMKGRHIFASGISDYHRGRREFLADQRFISHELVFNWCVPGPVFLARRSVYSRLGDYDENLVVEDRDFYLRLAAHNLIGFINSPVAAYRVRLDTSRYERSVAAEIRITEGLLGAIINNMQNYSGLCRIFLRVEALTRKSMLDRLRNKRTPDVFLRLKAGRLLRSFLRKYYMLWSRVIRATSP